MAALAFFCTKFKSAIIVKCLIFYFFPPWTGLLSIQLFSVDHAYISDYNGSEYYIQRYMLNIILTNEWTNI